MSGVVKLGTMPDRVTIRLSAVVDGQVVSREVECPPERAVACFTLLLYGLRLFAEKPQRPDEWAGLTCHACGRQAVGWNVAGAFCSDPVHYPWPNEPAHEH